MIGNQPLTDEIIIAKGQDLTHYFPVTPDDPLPRETQAHLYLLSRDKTVTFGLWPAVLVEDGGCQFQIDADDLDSIPDGAKFRLYLTHEDYGRMLWQTGSVWRRD